MPLGQRMIRFAGGKLIDKLSSKDALSPEAREKFMALLDKVFRLQEDPQFMKELAERIHIRDLMSWIETYPEVEVSASK